MTVVYCEHVPVLQNEFISSMEVMQSSFDQRVIHDTFEETAFSFCDPNPEIFTPAT